MTAARNCYNCLAMLHEHSDRLVRFGFDRAESTRPQNPCYGCRELEDELVRDMTYESPETITIKAAGGVGVDLNADCLALPESDRYGNLIHSALLTA